MSRRVTAAVAAFALTTSLGFAPSVLAGDQGRGDERPESAPGQQKKEEHAADPQQAPRGEAKGHEKQAQREEAPPVKGQAEKPAQQQAAQERAAENKAAGRQDAKPPKAQPEKKGGPKKGGPKKPKPQKGKPQGGNGPAPQSQAGKITICHATGSETNPYVEITISRNGLNGHRDHQDGRDIIPAPAEGCPGGTDQAPGDDKAKPGKITICHATGSETNPYVVIEISTNGLNGHGDHEGDIIPAPAEGCPGGEEAGGTPPTVTTPPTDTNTPPRVDGPGLTPGPDAGTTTSTPAGTPVTGPEGAVLGDVAEGAPADDAAQGGVLPEAAEAAPAARREQGTSAPAAAGQLPFTGLDVAIVLALGLAALLGGVALHRSLSRNAG